MKNYSDWLSTLEDTYLNQMDPSLWRYSDFSMERQAIEDGYYEFFSNND